MILAVYILVHSLVQSKSKKLIWVSTASLYLFINTSSSSISLSAMVFWNNFIIMVFLWSGGVVGMADFNLTGEEPKAWLRSRTWWLFCSGSLRVVQSAEEHGDPLVHILFKLIRCWGVLVDTFGSSPVSPSSSCSIWSWWVEMLTHVPGSIAHNYNPLQTEYINQIVPIMYFDTNVSKYKKQNIDRLWIKLLQIVKWLID